MKTIFEAMGIGALFFVAMSLLSLLDFISYPW